MHSTVTSQLFICCRTWIAYVLHANERKIKDGAEKERRLPGVKRCGCCCLRWLAVADTAAGPGGAASPMLLLCFFSLFPLIFFCFALSSSSFLLLLSVFLLFFSLFLCFLLLLLLFLSCSVFFPLSYSLFLFSLSLLFYCFSSSCVFFLPCI